MTAQFTYDQKLIVSIMEHGRRVDYGVRVLSVSRSTGAVRCIATHVPSPYEYLTFQSGAFQDLQLGHDGVVSIQDAPWAMSLEPIPWNAPKFRDCVFA